MFETFRQAADYRKETVCSHVLMPSLVYVSIRNEMFGELESHLQFSIDPNSKVTECRSTYTTLLLRQDRRFYSHSNTLFNIWHIYIGLYSLFYKIRRFCEVSKPLDAVSKISNFPKFDTVRSYGSKTLYRGIKECIRVQVC